MTYFELQERREFADVGGKLRHGFFSNWHCGPA